MKIYMTIRETSEYTGLSQHYIRLGCRSGAIPHMRAGNKYLINVPAMLDMLRTINDKEYTDE